MSQHDSHPNGEAHPGAGHQKPMTHLRRAPLSVGDQQGTKHDSGRPHSITASSISPRMTPSTKAIVDEADISLDGSEGHGSPDLIKMTTFGNNNPFCENNLNRDSAPSMDDDQLPYDGPGRTQTNGRYNHSPATEVIVHVNYGSTLSQTDGTSATRLGNSIVIGSDNDERYRK